MKLKPPSLNRVLIVIALAAVIVVAVFFIWWQREILVSYGGLTDTPTPVSPLTGEACSRATQRPIAVMMASDPVARPISGIGQADIVVEMPVTPGANGVTRMMALFQCQDPPEIGSIRSARGSFIPLAAGFDALYAHWGGEFDALQQLNTGVVDNIDALIYEGSTFYRKTGIPKPHNGFTTLALLRARAALLKYPLTATFTGYTRRKNDPSRNLSTLAGEISVGYAAPYDVRWEYDAASGLYRRFRNGTPEIDKTTGQQVTARNVIIMKTTAEPLRDQYLTVAITGQGQATLYDHGARFNVIWKKDPATLGSKLEFLDSKGLPAPLSPGVTWIEIVIDES